VLTGHTGHVGSVAWTPDGALLASSSGDTIRFWDPRTGRLQRTLNIQVASMAFSPDGKTLASALPQSVKLWHVRTGALIRELPAGDGNAWQVPIAFSPDSQRLVLATRPDAESKGSSSTKPVSGQLTLWDVATGIAKWSVTLQGRKSLYPAAVAFSPNGKTIATGEWGYGAEIPIGNRVRAADIHLWDAETGALQRTLTGHTAAVVSLTFSPDGQTLMSGGFDCTVRVWDAHTGAPLKTLAGKDFGGVMEISLSRDGRMLAAGYAEGEVRLWDARTGRLTRTMGWSDTVMSVALSPDGKLIASGAALKTGLRVWDARTGALKWIPAGQKGGARWVAFTPDGKVLASAGSDGTVKRWDTRTRAELRAIEGQPGPNWFALSPDGRLLARPGTDKEYWLWDLETGEPVRTLPGHNPLGAGVAFSADGNTAATCSAPEEGDTPAEIRFWDARSWKPLRTLNGHTGPITGFALSPDGTTLATGCPPVIRLWDVETGELKRTLPGSPWQRNLVFSPDGKILASPDGGLINLWRVVTGTLLRRLEGHGQFGSLSFSSDGQRLVSGGDDHVRVWEVSTGRLLGRLITLPPARPEQVPTDWLAISPEGYYDCSPGAARFISWIVGSDLFPLEAYERTFHRPDLLRRSLASEPIAQTPQLHRFTAGQAVPPQVTITRPHDGQSVSGDTLRVELTVSGLRSELRIEIRVNGRPVPAKPITVGGKPLPRPATPSPPATRSIQMVARPITVGSKPITVGGKPIPAAHRFLQKLTALVPLPAGDTRLTLKAIATDADALQGWDELHLSRPIAAARLPVAGQGDLHVLSIGVSRYQNPRFNLKYAAKDATAFARLWSPMEGSLYRQVHLTSLTDSQATTANVRASLFQLLERARARDSVALFLSGHGVQASEGAFYFATHDIDAGSAQKAERTGLPWRVFETILAKLDARRVFLFLDACHSGSALGERQASNERLAEALVKRSGVMVFASSRGGEVSYEDEALRHGAFTAAILEGIGQGKADLTVGGRDGKITAEELLAYLRIRVPQLTKNQQTPTCPLLYDFGEAFLLARTR
jgi:WD40 repeat protein